MNAERRTYNDRRENPLDKNSYHACHGTGGRGVSVVGFDGEKELGKRLRERFRHECGWQRVLMA
jgi:hypothetical protein